MIATDKRSRRRYAMALPLQLSAGVGAAPQIQGCSRDISAEGIYFNLPEPCLLGSLLEFELPVPPELAGGSLVRLRCRGRVVRIERRGEPERVGVAATIERYQFVKVA